MDASCCTTIGKIIQTPTDCYQKIGVISFATLAGFVAVAIAGSQGISGLQLLYVGLPAFFITACITCCCYKKQNSKPGSYRITPNKPDEPDVFKKYNIQQSEWAKHSLRHFYRCAKPFDYCLTWGNWKDLPGDIKEIIQSKDSGPQPEYGLVYYWMSLAGDVTKRHYIYNSALENDPRVLTASGARSEKELEPIRENYTKLSEKDLMKRAGVIKD